MKYLGLGTKTIWLALGKDISGCVLYWSKVVCGNMLSDSLASQIFRPLEMHLTVNWQLVECMLLVCCWI